MSEIKIWAESTDMAGTTVERKKYFIDLQDGEKRIQFILEVQADGHITAVPYVPVDYDYDTYDQEEDEDEDYYGQDEDYYSGENMITLEDPGESETP